MPGVLFEHSKVNDGNPLVIDTGMNEVMWGYGLHVAKFPTYGGEVVQILSAYIEDMTVAGTVPSYAKAEEIYSFFMQYFVKATQGEGHGTRYEQEPMIMHYPHRSWTFEIQPLTAPGFVYSSETVAPVWSITAHVVDRGLDVESLKAMVVKETIHEQQHKDEFKLTGVISPDSANPALNPFIAPVTPTGKKGPNGLPEFKEAEAKAVTAGLGKIADYYNHLLPAYLEGNFEDIITAAGAKPAFGHESTTATEAEGHEQPEETLKAKTANPSSNG